MKRYLINISFKTAMLEDSNNIVERVKTKREALKYIECLVDETVDRALVRDKVTGKLIFHKKY